MLNSKPTQTECMDKHLSLTQGYQGESADHLYLQRHVKHVIRPPKLTEQRQGCSEGKKVVRNEYREHEVGYPGARKGGIRLFVQGYGGDLAEGTTVSEY